MTLWNGLKLSAASPVKYYDIFRIWQRLGKLMWLEDFLSSKYTLHPTLYIYGETILRNSFSRFIFNISKFRTEMYSNQILLCHFQLDGGWRNQRRIWISRSTWESRQKISGIPCCCSVLLSQKMLRCSLWSLIWQKISSSY